MVAFMTMAYTGATAALFGLYGHRRLSTYQCPPDSEIILQEDFDLDRYTGRWFEFQRKADLPFQSGDCGFVEYTKTSDNSIKVRNTEYREKTGEFSGVTGQAQASNWNSGQARVRFFPLQPWGDYRVLSTDYDTYAIVYGCSAYLAGTVNFNALWMITRQPYEIGTPEHKEIYEKMAAIVEENASMYDLSWQRDTIQLTDFCNYPFDLK